MYIVNQWWQAPSKLINTESMFDQLNFHFIVEITHKLTQCTSGMHAFIGGVREDASDAYP